MTRMFQRPVHQAHERRAKQDEIQNKISTKFDHTAVESKKDALVLQASYLNDVTEAMLAREAQRKEVEAKTKQALEM